MANPAQQTKKSKGSYKKRLLTSALVILGLVFTVVFFGPLELVAFSGDSLLYTYQDIQWLLMAMSVAILVITAPLLALIRGKAFRIVMSIFSGVTIAAYLQALLLNDGLGLLTGDAIAWEHYTTNMCLSGGLWLAVIGGLCVLAIKKPKWWKSAVRYGALLLVIMQLVPTVSIYLGVYSQTKVPSRNYYLSDSGIDVAGSENVYVFVLDRLDYDYIERALKVQPDLLDGLDGFIGYTNAMSAFARTKPALVNMLAGQGEGAFHDSYSAYYNQVWQRDTVLSALKQGGWQVDLYTSVGNLFSDAAVAEQYASNLTDSITGVNYSIAPYRLLQLSAFRYSPTVLKPLFWEDTNYFNTDMVVADDSAPYQYNDVGFARRLEQMGQSEGKQFKLIHFFGPHAPYTMNADGTLAEGETTLNDQMIGSITNLKRIFDRMKALGIYEDATIIITGDHGNAVSDMKPMQKATRIGLFYKPAGSAGTPLQTSKAPVSAANIPATIAKGAGLDYSALGTPLDEVAEDAQITRVYYKTVCDPETYRERWLYTYHVTGDAADFSNWTLVSEEEIYYSYN